MAVFEQTFRAGAETIHAVLLKQPARMRWNAFLWGSHLTFANSFARREAAEKWLADLVHRYFPSIDVGFLWGDVSSDDGSPERHPGLMREPIYRGS